MANSTVARKRCEEMIRSALCARCDGKLRDIERKVKRLEVDTDEHRRSPSDRRDDQITAGA
jgi:hypothetical protein